MPVTPPDHAALRATADAEARAEARIFNSIALLRLLAGAALVLGLIGMHQRPGPPAFALVLGGGFALLLLALWHGAVVDRRDAARRRARYHSEGIARIAGTWRADGDGGLSATPADHPYARDLDLVGPGGLFARLDTAASSAGRERLLAWLLDDAWDAERPALVAALAERHAWRARLAAAGDRTIAGGALGAWLATCRTAPALLALPVWCWRAVAVAIIGWAAWQHGLGGLVLAMLGLAMPASLLEAWARTRLGAVAPERLLAELTALRAGLAAVGGLGSDGAPPPALVRRRDDALAALAGARALERLAERIAQRGNPLWAHVVGACWLAECGNLLSAGRLVPRHREDAPRWAAGLAEVDALACLATWAAEQGGAAPTIAADGPLLEAEALAHPLLPASARVGNPARLQAGEVLLVTGANASGKSTYLRAVALAVVLARLGLPAPARSLRLRRMRLATVMRVGDDLAASMSRFQAEVAALRRAIDRAASPGDPVLVVLDEILGGTNSRERHLGTAGVLAALRRLPGAALVSTHDLELCRLADADRGVRLAHFADSGGESDLLFDYQLRPGPATSTNAITVMRRAGLPV